MKAKLVAVLLTIPLAASAGPYDGKPLAEKAKAAFTELLSEGKQATQVPAILVQFTGTQDTWSQPSRFARASRVITRLTKEQAIERFNKLVEQHKLTDAYKFAVENDLHSKITSLEGESLMSAQYRLATYGPQTITDLFKWHEDLYHHRFSSNQVGEDIILGFEFLSGRLGRLASNNDSLLIEFQSSTLVDTSPIMKLIQHEATHWFASQTMTTPDGGILVLMNAENVKRFYHFYNDVYGSILFDTKQVWAFQGKTTEGKEHLVEIYTGGEKTVRDIRKLAQTNAEMDLPTEASCRSTMQP